MRRSLMLAVRAVAWLAVGCAVAQGSALPTPVPHGGTRAARQPAAHEDGLIAVAGVTRTDIAGIYTMRPDGSQLRFVPLPTALLPNMVALSPDGQHLAFDSGNIFGIGTDGRGLRQLTPQAFNGPGNSFNTDGPETWSPNGQWIAFRAFVLQAPPPSNEVEAAVFAVRANGTGLHQVLSGFAVTSLAWGPGDLLAVTGTPYPARSHWPAGATGIWTVAMNTADARPIPGSVRLLDSWSSSPVTVDGWSPDGRSLLIYDAPRRGDLSILPASGGRPRVLLDCPAQTCTGAHYLSSAAWATDGSSIMFTVNPDDPDGSTSASFYTIPASGGRLTLLHLSFMRLVSGLSWQPAR
jgi:Tol biopolymer transport system component